MCWLPTGIVRLPDNLLSTMNKTSNKIVYCFTSARRQRFLHADANTSHQKVGEELKASQDDLVTSMAPSKSWEVSFNDNPNREDVDERRTTVLHAHSDIAWDCSTLRIKIGAKL